MANDEMKIKKFRSRFKVLLEEFGTYSPYRSSLSGSSTSSGKRPSAVTPSGYEGDMESSLSSHPKSSQSQDPNQSVPEVEAIGMRREYFMLPGSEFGSACLFFVLVQK